MNNKSSITCKQQKYEKVCKQCGEWFNTSIPHQKTCSKPCQEVFSKNQAILLGSEYGDMSTSTKGAISELLVSADLLKRGLAVFRSLSPSCFCDIIAINGEKRHYIEVRTGRVGISGNVTFSGQYQKGVNVIAVFVQNTQEIRYYNTKGSKIEL